MIITRFLVEKLFTDVKKKNHTHSEHSSLRSESENTIKKFNHQCHGYRGRETPNVFQRTIPELDNNCINYFGYNRKLYSVTDLNSC